MTLRVEVDGCDGCFVRLDGCCVRVDLECFKALLEGVLMI